MPSSQKAGFVRVHKRHRGGQGNVIVDDVGQVCHGFVAFVHWGPKSVVGGERGGRVDGVNGTLPARRPKT